MTKQSHQMPSRIPPNDQLIRHYKMDTYENHMVQNFFVEKTKIIVTRILCRVLSSCQITRLRLDKLSKDVPRIFFWREAAAKFGINLANLQKKVVVAIKT